MENVSPSLVLFGAIIAMNIVIATGVKLYTTTYSSFLDNSSSSSIDSTIANMSTVEIEAFNAQFEGYSGKQPGSQISALLGRLIANANTYKDNANKVPKVVCENFNNQGYNINVVFESQEGSNTYIDDLISIKNKLENKHTYSVVFNYGVTGLIDTINIEY